MTRHNKKRNAGLMYEFLIRSISRFLVEGNNENAEITKKIIKKYYNSNTELHKEYRLINALVNVPVGSDTVATAVLQEARLAATRFDSKALKIEKGNMIKEINHAFGPDYIYAESVTDYKLYATASTLIKYWRGEKNLDINTVVKYEKNLFESLARQKPEHVSEVADPNVDSLVVKVASNRMKKKYEGKLTRLQTEIINLYAVENDIEKTAKKINEIKDSVSSKLEKYSNEKNGSIVEKIGNVIQKIKHLNTDNIDDKLIARVLEVVRLDEELDGVNQ